MQTDYADAHERHWTDAELLHRRQRLANADHLFGLAAECGLKRLMLAFGMPYDQERELPEERRDRRHVDALWERYDAYRCGRPEGTNYGLPLDNPFTDWSISQRYAVSSAFDDARVRRHEAGARTVRWLLLKARREGLI